MHALHQLQDKLPDDVAVMLSQIDGSLVHTLQLVVVVLQFISRIKAVLVELSEQTGEPYGVQITHQIARPFLVVVTSRIVGYKLYHTVGIVSGQGIWHIVRVLIFQPFVGTVVGTIIEGVAVGDCLFHPTHKTNLTTHL